MIYVNDVPVEFSRYPNGETVVPNFESLTVSRVRLHWEGDHDLLQLALVKGLLDQRDHAAELLIDYMPYSRMDREQDGHCFSLQYVAELLSFMDFRRIKVVEPHSAVTLELLGVDAPGRLVEPIWATAKLAPLAMADMDFNPACDYLVVPDKGAYERYSELLGELFDKCNVITFKKDRDFATGKIYGLRIAHRRLVGSGAAVPAESSKALIIDDLSSRGGTFVQAYRILRHGPLRCSSVNLLVTHMEPVGFTGELPTYLDKVYCTDTMHWPIDQMIPKNFHVFPRSDWL